MSYVKMGQQTAADQRDAEELRRLKQDMQQQQAIDMGMEEGRNQLLMDIQARQAEMDRRMEQGRINYENSLKADNSPSFMSNVGDTFSGIGTAIRNAANKGMDNLSAFIDKPALGVPADVQNRAAEQEREMNNYQVQQAITPEMLERAAREYEQDQMRGNK